MNRVALYHIETLLWIDRLGTFAAAADRLNATQPTISARIRELEGHLGIKLFNRSGRRMNLSVRGRELVERWQHLWPLVEVALLATDNFQGATGIVRIGSGEIAAASCLPSFVSDLKNEMPGVTLDIEIDLSSRLIDRLLDGTVDLVFAIGPVEMPGCATRTIGHVDLLWLAAPEIVSEFAQAGQADEELTLWALGRSSPMHRIMTDSLREQHLESRSVNTCNDIHSLIDIVTAGCGAGLFPANMVQNKLASGALAPIFSQSPKPIVLQVIIKSGEIDPVVARIFDHASNVKIT